MFRKIWLCAKKHAIHPSVNFQRDQGNLYDHVMSTCMFMLKMNMISIWAMELIRHMVAPMIWIWWSSHTSWLHVSYPTRYGCIEKSIRITHLYLSKSMYGQFLEILVFLKPHLKTQRLLVLNRQHDRLHASIFLFILLNRENIMQIPLNGSIIFHKYWIWTG